MLASHWPRVTDKERYFHLRAHGFRKGDEHFSSEVWPLLPVLIAVFERCFRSEVWIGSTCLNSDGW